jgi:hypothetical protein
LVRLKALWNPMSNPTLYGRAGATCMWTLVF